MIGPLASRRWNALLRALLLIGIFANCPRAKGQNLSDAANNVRVTLRWDDALDSAAVDLLIYRADGKIFITSGIFQDASALRSETISKMRAIGFDMNLGIKRKCDNITVMAPLRPGWFIGNHELCAHFLGARDNVAYFDVISKSFGEFSRGREVLIQANFAVTFGIPCRSHLFSAYSTYAKYPGYIAVKTRVREQSCLNLLGR